MDLHLIPGHFSDAAERMLESLATGGPQIRVRGRGETPCEPSDIVALGHVTAGEGKRLEVVARVMASSALDCVIEAFGAPSAGRVLLGVSLDSSDPQGATIKDLELGLLGLACAALAKEEQGVVILGGSLGPVGAGLQRGTVSEQVQTMLEMHGGAVEVIVATASTAERLGVIDDFARSELGNLIEYRRLGDERVIPGDQG